MSTLTKLEQVIALIDKANAEDPNQVTDENGNQWPKESLYAHRMTDMLNRYTPEADDVAHISVRGQHVQRWKSPRKDYPMNRQGYLKWRTELYKFHANTTVGFMQEAGYDQDSMDRVAKAVGKRALKVNADTQLLEDVIDLVFIEHYMTEFVAGHPEYDEDKWIDIIRKTWKKMSDQAHEFTLAGNMKLPEKLAPLILKAVG